MYNYTKKKDKDLTKTEFRQKCKKVLSRKNSYFFSKKTQKQLIKKLNNKKYKNILLYVSMPHEVQTKQLIFELKKRNKKIFVPFMEGLSFKMVKYSMPLKKKKFNIYEPKNKNKAYEKIDVAVVPVLGVDAEFKRVGFGKGMYDRFFDNLKYETEIVFTQIYPCITNQKVTDRFDIQGDSFIAYNLVCDRRKNDSRSVGKFRDFGCSRFFCSKKNR